MSAKLNVLVEGQTEEAFVAGTLAPHLSRLSVRATARCVQTGSRGGYVYRGGLSLYRQAKTDITAWMREDPEAWLTTMFDLYKLPNSFPGNQDKALAGNPYERVEALERALSEEIASPRFIPYIQLHEFEALLLADPPKLGMYFDDCPEAVRKLAAMAASRESPELIDEGEETAPSKRIIAAIPEYRDAKKSAGPMVAGYIGLPAMRAKCKHFADWLSKLESLATIGKAE